MQNYKSVTVYQTKDGKQFIDPKKADKHIYETINTTIHEILKQYISVAKLTELNMYDVIGITDFLYENRETIKNVLNMENYFNDNMEA